MQKYQKTSTFSIDPNVGEELFKKIDKEFKINMNILDARCTRVDIHGLSRAYGLITCDY